MRDALREAALFLRDPARHRRRCSRERRAFTETEHEARGEQRSEPAREAREHRRETPDRATEQQRASRAEAIAYPAADHLKHQIRIREGREHEADLRMREIEFLAETRRRSADVYAIEVRDEVHVIQSAHRRAPHIFSALLKKQVDLGGRRTLKFKNHHQWGLRLGHLQ